jgi:hypothetical protein
MQTLRRLNVMWLLVVMVPFALVARSASAQTCRSSVYHPAAYTNSAAGDVALTPAESALVEGLSQTLGLTYGHAATLYDNSGHVFTESTVTNASPPSSKSTGEPHICSRVISPYYLQRLSPGVLNGTSRDARAGVLVKGGARASCIAPADTYHINSIKYRLHGGSCAALAEDDCGAAVTGSWQRSFTYSDHYRAAIFLYQNAYNLCLGMINGSWPWGGIGCGGVSATGEYYGLEQNGNASGCDRAASQVVNEFATKGGSYCAAGVCDGWTDYSVFGQMLGGAKDNWQVGNLWWNNYQSFTPRVPDNILASAASHGHAVVATNIAAGYYTSTTAPNGSCCGAGCCGSCDAGICDLSECGGGGGGPAIIKY